LHLSLIWELRFVMVGQRSFIILKGVIAKALSNIIKIRSTISIRLLK